MCIGCLKITRYTKGTRPSRSCLEIGQDQVVNPIHTHKVITTKYLILHRLRLAHNSGVPA